MNHYLLWSFGLAAVILTVFFFSYEKKHPQPGDIMVIVVICAMASLGRVIFAFLPQIQPVTALVIIMGVCFGIQPGFLTGTLCALVSNMILGQGPWTIFQMLAWGIIGIISGLLFSHSKSSTSPLFLTLLSVWGFVSAFLYSILTDLWTLLSLGDQVTLGSAMAVLGSGLLFNIGHAIGNVAFLLLLYPSLNRIFTRLQKKYGVLLP